MDDILLEAVFKRSGVPTYTFVEPREYRHLKVALRTAGRGVIVEGPSGIGKTTAVLTAVSQMGLTDRAQKLSARIKEDCEIIEMLPEMVRSPGGAGMIIVDDFHRLPDAVKHKIADLMKDMADREDHKTKIVLIGINKAGNSLVNFAPDLNNRIDTIRFETNSVEEVRSLIAKGEEALNIKIRAADARAKDARGSFHIAQILCHDVCLMSNVTESQEALTPVDVSLEAVKDRVLDELGRNFTQLAIKFARGPRFRRVGRAPYLHLLRWLAESKAGALSIEAAMATHPENRGSVGQIVEKPYLAGFLEKNSDLQDIIHFDEYTKILAIEDPKFIYYIKNILWAKFVKEAGFISIDFKAKYDFAMSFAGEVRPLIELVRSYLKEEEAEVFYDYDEQHLIVGKDVEEYLAPIYRSEARFVVAFLSEHYPRKIWTKFESDVFKSRFGDNCVMPIRFTNVPTSAFDLTSTVGGLSFNPSESLEAQAQKIAQTLLRRLEEEKAQEAAMIHFDLPEPANDQVEPVNLSFSFDEE